MLKVQYFPNLFVIIIEITPNCSKCAIIYRPTILPVAINVDVNSATKILTFLNITKKLRIKPFC